MVPLMTTEVRDGSAAGACFIELRANEQARRERTGGRHLPFSPREIIDDALAAEAAGAAVLHWHARDAVTGEARNEVELFASVARELRARSELLLHPTLGGSGAQDPVARTAHIGLLDADPETRVDLVPIDFGSINIDLWDAAARRFRSEDRAYLNPRWALRAMLERFAALDVTVISVCWHPGQVRTACRFRDMGLLGPTMWQLAFTGDALPDGMPPTRMGLEAMVEQVPAGEPWTVLVNSASPLELAAWAIELGGHVSTGLGDWGFPELGGDVRNADVVAHVAGLVRAAGRTVATPAQTRALLGVRAAA
jgi:3-keto-5-aminohexanoate cleavage enzyme